MFEVNMFVNNGLFRQYEMHHAFVSPNLKINHLERTKIINFAYVQFQNYVCRRGHHGEFMVSSGRDMIRNPR